MTVAMAEKLTGIANAESFLLELSRRNHFTDWVPGPEPFFRYHSLFRDFLMARANIAFDYKKIKDIQRTSANILKEHGFIEDAVSLYSETADRENLATVILERADELSAQGRHKMLFE